MAEMVASAVVGETLSRVSAFLIDQPEQKPSEQDDEERLEMAHIKMEAALRMSSRWQITEVPMLRWRRKLKRAAQECDSSLRHRKQRALELEDDDTRRSSFPRRVARAAKSFVSSFSCRGKADADESSSSSSSASSVDIRRLERFAEGASEFLRFVEFGGAPGRQHVFFNPLVGDLLAGKTLRYRALRGGRLYHLGMRPTRFAERGVEAMVWFAFQDLREPAKSINFRFMLRLSESSDVFGVIIECLRSAATPHFMAAAEDLRRELVQLPTQDFRWVSQFPYAEKKYWVDVHSTLTRWLRPDPLCCDQHEHDMLPSSMPTLSSMYPEEVIVMYLQCYVELSDEQRSRQKATENGRRRTRNSGSAPPLKLGALFIPHDSPISIEPAAESYALEVIDGKEQETVHKNLSLQDVDEKLLPKAIDHLCQNPNSRTYQMCLRSSHGTAYLCVDKAATRVPSSGRSKTAGSPSTQVWNKRMGRKQEGNGMEGWLEVSRDLLKLWAVRASDQLHGSVRSWIVNSPQP
ncbi:hypothetical protein QYE76_067272 [Lolium multiflorum]|uniref:WW domain-containing protein n=1 Tax=Lolium multiflorum TaxID=4521 RepID=A0AAD8SE73_LOLMU|nr:hypothetical protein QYE76_067272 [Lolium multiflorum]